jgi:hypothetical protein
MKKILIVLISVSGLVISCSKSDSGSSASDGGTTGGTTTNCTSVPQSFITDVNPIIQSFCNNPGCHNSGSTNGVGPLTNYNQVFASRTAIRSAISSGTMPLGATLSTAQKNSIVCWIDNGANNN